APAHGVHVLVAVVIDGGNGGNARYGGRTTEAGRRFYGSRAIHVAAAVLSDHGKTRLHGVAQRTTDGRARFDRVVAAVAQIDVAGERVRRACGDDVDRARRRIAPVERNLRPLQDFDALDIEEGKR